MTRRPFTRVGFAILVFCGAAATACAGGSSGEEGTVPGGDSSATDDTGGSSSDTSDDTGTTGDDTGGTADSGGDDTGGSADSGDLEASSDTGADDTGGATDSGGDDSGSADTGSTVDTGPETPPDPCSGTLSCTTDSDGDTIPDAVEGRCAAGAPKDTDGDGTPDYLDTDSDGDGISDKTEWFGGGCDPTGGNDADGDGTPNFQDTDSDGNGLLDKDEACAPSTALTALGLPACTKAAPSDVDGDGVPDYLDDDNDNDGPGGVGLDDKFELTDPTTGTYLGLLDTDGDGIPDVWDKDSDNDFILDAADGLNDVDKDGKLNFRDTDSDADGVPDACEARAKASPTSADYSSPLLDTDGDGKYDYVDLDSDADLLVDSIEDKNGNCIVDTGETNRLLKDTDGDGIDDFIEVTLDTGKVGWATDPTKNPTNQGKFYFIEPYNAPPTPTSSLLALSTDLQKGDLGIVMDTSFSMNGPFTNLKTNLSSIITTLKGKLPDLGIGLAGHDDIPTAQDSSTTNLYGSCLAHPPTIAVSDDPFYLLTAVTTNTTTATTAVAGFRMGDGWDLAEDQVVAMHYAITGNGFSWPSLNGCPAGSRAAVADSATNFGAMRFRKDALPIVLSISDAEFHNGRHTTPFMPKVVLASSTTVNTTVSWRTYDPGSTTPAYYLDGVNAYSFTVPNISDLATALKAKGARFIGGATDDSRAVQAPPSPPAGYVANAIYHSGPSSGVTGTLAARDRNYSFSAFGDMEYLVDQTTSYVDPADFTHGATCAVGQCCTGFNGAGIAPDAPGGKCKLVFNVNHNGNGLNQQIVDSVVALINAIRFDAYVQATPDPGPIDSVDNFMTAIQPSATSGTDPVTTKTCVTVPGTADKYHTPKALAGAGDVAETGTNIKPGTLYCFDVVPKKNTTVPATSSAQTFRATLQVYAENGTGKIALGTPREVLFVVPPIAN